MRAVGLVGLSLVLAASRAHAASVARDVQATKLHLSTQVLSPGYSYKISTDNLTPGGDTVLHVQSASGGYGFIAGNDDCGASLRSCVTIPSSTNTRTVQIVVRSYSTGSAGAGFLKVERCSGTTCTTQATEYMVQFAGTSVYAGTLPAQTRFTTVRQASRANVAAVDTVILVRAGKERGIAFDDEGGLESLPETTFGMSMAQIAEACSGCYVTVGVYTGTPIGAVSLVTDEAWSTDSDGDGASNALEASLGTAATRPDTDEDGILDGEEIYGVRAGATVLQFPHWGANPLHKDMFVELDWEQDPAKPAFTYQPTDADINWVIDKYAANDAANRAGNPDGVGGISVHVDSGLSGQPNRHGTWGGASAVAPAVGCGGLTAERRRYFHHIFATKDGTGSAGPGTCVGAQYQSGAAMVHELGHNLYLNHSGLYRAVANCKPLYRSVMNYLGEPTFSDGKYAATRLNATRLSERTPIAGDVSWLNMPPYYFKVDTANGWVDWNHDGRFEDGARGAPNFIDGGGCEIAMPHRTDFNNDSAKTYQSAFLGRLGASLYMFTVDGSGALEQRRAGNLTGCDASAWGNRCPQSWAPLTRVPGATADGPGDAVALVHPLTLQPRLAVVYKARTANRANEPVHYQLMTGGAGAEQWSAPRPVHPTAVATSSQTEPTVVNQDGLVLMFLPLADGYLHEYQYDAAADLWTHNGVAQLDGAPFIMIPDDGLGVVAGYQRWGTATSNYVFGVFRDPIDARISLVRRGPFGTWTRLLAGPADPQTHRATTTDVPRIAYTPFRPDVPWDGRFTIVWRIPGGNTRMMITEGNDWAGVGERRFQFLPMSADPLNWWAAATDAYSLLSDPDGVRATVVSPGAATFYPFFDGVFDAEQTDNADFTVLGAQLDCSLRCPAAANPWTRDRCCPSGITGYGQDADCDQVALAPTCTFNDQSR